MAKTSSQQFVPTGKCIHAFISVISIQNMKRELKDLMSIPQKKSFAGDVRYLHIYTYVYVIKNYILDGRFSFKVAELNHNVP